MSNSKVILLTAIESLREGKAKKTKKAKKVTKKRQEDKSKGEIKRPRSATLDIASVETSEAWSNHSISERKIGYQWINGLKMLGILKVF